MTSVLFRPYLNVENKKTKVVQDPSDLRMQIFLTSPCAIFLTLEKQTDAECLGGFSD